jgi:hypothetical protein
MTHQPGVSTADYADPHTAEGERQKLGMDETGVRRVLDVALRFGQLLLGCQAGTADVASTIVAVTSAYGVPATHVDITANSITVSVPRAVPGAPVNAMYMVESRSPDYTRLQLATDLAQHVVDTTGTRVGTGAVGHLGTGRTSLPAMGTTVAG